MAGSEPEVGDKVSWNWGSGAPGGTVAEKKTEGDIAIKSKRGNTIKKHAEPGNPAVHIERSGNDVVKKVSELNVEKKASGGQSNGKKREAEEDEPTVENDEGKEVKPGGKKQKTAPAKKDEKKAEKNEEKNEEKKEEKKEDKKEEKKEAPAEKKKAGRPKKGEGEKKAKKQPTPRSADGIGSRTRSRK